MIYVYALKLKKIITIFFCLKMFIELHGNFRFKKRTTGPMFKKQNASSSTHCVIAETFCVTWNSVKNDWLVLKHN